MKCCKVSSARQRSPAQDCRCTPARYGFVGAPTVAGTVDVAKLGYYYAHSADSIKPVTARTGASAMRSMPLASALKGASESVVLWGGKGPFSFTVTPPANFGRADLWFDEIRIPSTLSYRANVYIHRLGKPWREQDAAGFINVWKGHTDSEGEAHHTTGTLFLTITDALRKAVASHGGEALAITVVVEPVVQAQRANTKSRPLLRSLSEEVQFKNLRLVLDGDGSAEVEAAASADHEH